MHVRTISLGLIAALGFGQPSLGVAADYKGNLEAPLADFTETVLCDGASNANVFVQKPKRRKHLIDSRSCFFMPDGWEFLRVVPTPEGQSGERVMVKLPDGTVRVYWSTWPWSQD